VDVEVVHGATEAHQLLLRLLAGCARQEGYVHSRASFRQFLIREGLIASDRGEFDRGSQERRHSIPKRLVQALLDPLFKRTYADPARRVVPPAGFTGGTQKTADGESVFIPQSATLGIEAGYMMPTYFWDYMNSVVFPASWLHDLGLPVSVPFEATVMKDSVEHVRPAAVHGQHGAGRGVGKKSGVRRPATHNA
jgi:hypothetical protein